MRQVNYAIRVPNVSLSLVGKAPQPQLSGYAHTNASYQDVAIQGNYAYVIGTGADGSGIIGLTLTVFNISNPAAPFYTGYVTTGSVPWTSGPPYLNGAYNIAVSGNYAYIGSSGSSVFYVVNISSPYNPYNVAALPITGTPGSLYGTSLSGNYVYLATQNKGLTVVNISNPLVPTQTFQEGGTLNKSIGVTAAGGFVYTTNYQTTSPWTVRYLKIWDISGINGGTPAVPVLLTTYTLPAGAKPAEVSIQNNIAYVSDLNTSSVYVINVANYAVPVYLSTLPASATFNVVENASPYTAPYNSSAASYAYVSSGANATYGGAIDFFNITNLSAPVKVATYTEGVPGSVFGAGMLYNNLYYVADYGVSPSYSASLNIYSTQTYLSTPIDSRNLFCVSAQITSALSTAAGTYELQGSDDPTSPVNWSSIPNTAGTVSGAGVYLVPKTDLSYEYIRFSYTNIGTGGLSAVIKALGD